MLSKTESFKSLIKILNVFLTLHPRLEPYLAANMKGQYYPKRKILFEPGDTANQALFVGKGFVMAYYFTLGGDKRVMHLHVRDSIIASESFMNQRPMSYYLEAAADSFLLSITAAQMEVIYKTIPFAEELSRKVIIAQELKELVKDELLGLPGPEKVLAFYSKHPCMLPSRGLITDLEVASYLHMSISHLRNIRADLIKKLLVSAKFCLLALISEALGIIGYLDLA
jgi:CRP-like cAMP-binding protein